MVRNSSRFTTIRLRIRNLLTGNTLRRWMRPAASRFISFFGGKLLRFGPGGKFRRLHDQQQYAILQSYKRLSKPE